MQPRTEFAKLLPSVGVPFTVGAPASAAAASAVRMLKPAALMLAWPTALDIAVMSSFIARASVRYATALVRIVGNEHADGLTLNCACVGVRGLFARSWLQATTARAPAAATMVMIRAFMRDSPFLDARQNRASGPTGFGEGLRQPAVSLPRPREAPSGTTRPLRLLRRPHQRPILGIVLQRLPPE